MTKFLSLLWSAGFVAAAAFISSDSAAEATPEVKQAYQGMTQYLLQHDAFSVDMVLEYTALLGDETQWLVTTFELAYQRPNLLSLKMTTPFLQSEIYYENGVMTHYLPVVNQYVQEPAHVTLPELVAGSGLGPIGDAMVIFSQLVFPEPFTVPLQYSVKSEHKGEVELDGNVYEKVWMDFEAVSWDAWIAKGDAPLLYRVVPKLPATETHLMQASEKHVEIDVVMDFKNWNFNPEEVREKLVFTQAATAERVESFEVPASQDPKEALLNKPAPAFEVSALDGSTFSLAEKKGKEILVLDFWATWCAPCRQAMPIMEKVTAEFADKDVRLYAVNVMEDAETIKAFLQEEGLNVNVLLDKTGAVQAAYLAEAIPQTVIVDKDGIVKAVHVGVSPELEQTLREELSSLTQAPASGEGQ